MGPGPGSAPRPPLAALINAQALEALRWHWGDAYEIGRDGEDGWRAHRRDAVGGDLTAPGPDELESKIRADYGLRPVPREDAP